MELLPNEKMITSSGGNEVILTNFRIMKINEDMGKSQKIFMFLEDISSIETNYKSYLILLVLAIASIIGGIYLDEFFIGAIIGIMFGVIWLFSRNHVIKLTPNGGTSLNVVIGNMAKEKVDGFIYQIQEAKFKRINQLFNSPTVMNQQT